MCSCHGRCGRRRSWDAKHLSTMGGFVVVVGTHVLFYGLGDLGQISCESIEVRWMMVD